MSTDTTFRPIVIRQPAAERVRVPVIVLYGSDPTSSVVEFALIPEDAEPVLLDWVAGGWGDWNPTGRTADAISPTIGGTGSGAAIEKAHGRWALWIKIDLAPETVVRQPVYVLIC